MRTCLGWVSSEVHLTWWVREASNLYSGLRLCCAQATNQGALIRESHVAGPIASGERAELALRFARDLLKHELASVKQTISQRISDG
jgi:hypothetical protein